MLVSEAFNRYIIDFIAMKGQSSKTQEAYENTRQRVLDRFGDVEIESLTFADIRDFKLWLDVGRSENTVRNYIICLRNIIRYHRRKGLQVIDSSDIPIPKRKSVIVEYLTDSEVRAFIRLIGQKRHGYSKMNRLRNVAIVETLYATGLRNAEICSLDRESIKNQTFTVIGKGSKPRIGFINERAIKAVDNYLSNRKDTNNALFIDHRGIRITPAGIRNMFAAVRLLDERFNFVHPHTIRHSYATDLLTRRVDIRYVQQLMGHSNLDTTAHYTHLVNEHLKDIYLSAKA